MSAHIANMIRIDTVLGLPVGIIHSQVVEVQIEKVGSTKFIVFTAGSIRI